MKRSLQHHLCGQLPEDTQQKRRSYYQERSQETSNLFTSCKSAKFCKIYLKAGSKVPASVTATKQSQSNALTRKNYRERNKLD